MQRTMRILVPSRRFEKNLKKFLQKHPELGNLIKEKLKILQNNTRDARLDTHKLSGVLKKYFGVSISHEYRLVISLVKNEIILHAIGTHDDVY